MPYLAEYTDTFGGEANYAWVRRAVLDMPNDPSWRSIMQAARKALNLTGCKGDITAEYGDEQHWVPRGCCTILMVRWCDEDEAVHHRTEVWSVEVGNVGRVFHGGERRARQEFQTWRKMSKDGEGRAAGESVTLMRDGEPVAEYLTNSD